MICHIKLLLLSTCGYSVNWLVQTQIEQLQCKMYTIFVNTVLYITNDITCQIVDFNKNI